MKVYEILHFYEHWYKILLLHTETQEKNKKNYQFYFGVYVPYKYILEILRALIDFLF